MTPTTETETQDVDLATAPTQNLFELVLAQAPGRIQRFEADLWKVTRRLELARERTREIEATTLGRIADAVDESSGKKRYTNEESRRARLVESLKADGEHERLRAEIREQEALLAVIERSLHRAENEQKNARAILLARAAAGML